MSNNRTSEFLSLARSLPDTGSAGPQSSGQRQPPQQANNKSDPSFAELRDFHQQASGISHDIASTSALLTELTHAVRHKSLFHDDSASVNALVVRIKGAIENLNARLETADRTIQTQKRLLGKNSQAGQEAANLVLGLQSEFAEAASGFKKVLQQRTESLKETEDMQRQVYSDMDEIPDMSRIHEPPLVFGGINGGGGGFPTLDLTSGLMSAGEPTGSSLPRPHGIAGISDGNSHNNNSAAFRSLQTPTYSGQYSNYSSGNSALLTPLDIQRMEQEQGDSQMLQLIPDQDYLQTRADAMSTVESNIVELGTIFNKLAGLVHEHREMVQRVEDNVEDANANIFQSMSVLTDTLQNLRSNRALAFRLFSVLVLFIIFFIVFFA
jgi:syntaxin 5